jgi:hypothetical protein
LHFSLILISQGILTLSGVDFSPASKTSFTLSNSAFLLQAASAPTQRLQLLQQLIQPETHQLQTKHTMEILSQDATQHQVMAEPYISMATHQLFLLSAVAPSACATPLIQMGEVEFFMSTTFFRSLSETLILNILIQNLPVELVML